LLRDEQEAPPGKLYKMTSRLQKASNRCEGKLRPSCRDSRELRLRADRTCMQGCRLIRGLQSNRRDLLTFEPSGSSAHSKVGRRGTGASQLKRARRSSKRQIQRLLTIKKGARSLRLPSSLVCPPQPRPRSRNGEGTERKRAPNWSHSATPAPSRDEQGRLSPAGSMPRR